MQYELTIPHLSINQSINQPTNHTKNRFPIPSRASSLPSTDQTSYASPTLRSVTPHYIFTDDCPTRELLSDDSVSCTGAEGFGTAGGENVTLEGIDVSP